MQSPEAAEPTILTRWGRLTGAQWLQARYEEMMDEWFTADLEAYLAAHWPTAEQIAANRQRSRREARIKRRQTNTPPASQLKIL
jgi:hypothetical protein